MTKNRGIHTQGGTALLWLNLLLLTMLAACSKPLLEGAQIEKVPTGFMLDLNASAARLVLPQREKLDQLGYWRIDVDDDTHCFITITEYSGLTTEEAAETAYLEAKQKYPHHHTYGPFELLTIARQPAFGWLETQMYKGEVSSLEYVAVISHEDEGVTYTVEFYASDKQYMDEAFLKETIQTFAVKHGGVSYGRIGIVVGLFAVIGLGIKRIGSR